MNTSWISKPDDGSSIEVVSDFIEEPSGFLKRPTTEGRCRLPKRYAVALLTSLGLFVMFWMRNNFGVTIFQIITTHAFSENAFFPKSEEWTIEEVGLMDSAFYWGFAAGQIPGALLVLTYNPHRLLLASVAVSSLLHMILPMTLNYHVGVVIFINLLQGIAEGPLYPACIGLWTQWAPRPERTRLVTLAFCGSYIGVVMGAPLSVYLVENIGEDIVFFASGIAGLIWCLLWSMLTFDSPSNDPFMSHAEFLYLEESTDPELKDPIKLKSIPLKSLLTSPPVIAICVASLCYSCCFYVAVTAPFHYFTFFDNIHSEHEALWKISLPHIFMAVIIPCSGLLADILINKTLLTTTVTRKVFCSGAFLLHGATSLVVVFCGDATIGFISLSVGSGLLGFAVTGYVVNCLDLCPRYASIVVGISQTFASLGGIIFPLVMDHLAPNKAVLFEELYGVFLTSSILSFVGAVVFVFFASGQLQPWAQTPSNGNENHCEQGNTSTDYYPKSDAEDADVLVTESL